MVLPFKLTLNTVRRFLTTACLLYKNVYVWTNPCSEPKGVTPRSSGWGFGGKSQRKNFDQMRLKDENILTILNNDLATMPYSLLGEQTEPIWSLRIMPF
jgi:hypothetical protein